MIGVELGAGEGMSVGRVRFRLAGRGWVELEGWRECGREAVPSEEPARVGSGGEWWGEYWGWFGGEVGGCCAPASVEGVNSP